MRAFIFAALLAGTTAAFAVVAVGRAGGGHASVGRASAPAKSTPAPASRPATPAPEHTPSVAQPHPWYFPWVFSGSHGSAKCDKQKEKC